ncbi:helix-turn-helix domain-containing protein [Brumimicrobium aurantiacum]|uniref:AraC family transcriptional regulator n=1 Tax=Brumimicrobium aurantiacum TaxID=1737063 RepID=A0A3E1EXR4_9FLAO|nr:response regulator transcription factor [Brumimicrobium aurantiacum]RFC54341.1 AraC family transcriptional regulator [Brumimicrobium aurantiacum]
MKSSIIIILIILFSFKAFGKQSYFDSIYRYTGQKLMTTDPQQALKNVDILYDISKSNDELIKSLLLKAGLLMLYGINDEAVVIFNQAEVFAQKEKDYTALTRIYGYRSSIYRESGLATSQLKSLEKALVYCKKIEEYNVRVRFLGNIQHEKALLLKNEKKYNQSIDVIRKSISLFNQIKDTTIVDVAYHLTNSFGLMSENKLLLGETDSSFYYLDLAEKHHYLSNYPQPTMLGLIYNGKGEAYLAIDEFEKAEENLLKAKKWADQTNFFELKKEVYPLLKELYQKTGQNSKFDMYKEEYNNILEMEKNSRLVIADKLIDALYAEQKNLEIKEQKNSRIILWLCVLTGFLIILLSWYIYKKRKNQKKFDEYINTLNSKNQDETLVGTNNVDEEPSDSKNYISKEKEQSILEGLQKFEKDELYLDSNVSLTSVSSIIGVNQRYLTYVIKKHLSTDFASYINELRINYIVQLLRKEPIYLSYKISVLAEEIGFSSHSRFTVNFKKVTGKTPSAYINYVRNQNERMSA